MRKIKHNIIVAVVGMTGSGKSVVTEILEKAGVRKIRFGDLTDVEVRRRGLAVNEANERIVRESLRKEHGMAAYAVLNIPKIREAVITGDLLIDGLYSWEEYLVLKKEFGDSIKVLAIHSPPALRHSRLGERKIRPLTPAEAASRDKAEIENLNKGGPIAMADWSIVNDGRPYEELVMEVNRTWARIIKS